MGKNKQKGREQKKKVNLIFDEDKRKDFLCGFRKRKLERKKKAQDELKTLLKVEKKRIKQENKESYKKLVVSCRPIPDIEQLLQEEYEDEDVNVKIVELSTDKLNKKDLWIGENLPKPIEKETKVHKSEKPKTNGISGMESEVEPESEDNGTDNDEREVNTKTKKEIKQMLKRQATKKIQNSKAYQTKSKLERVKNKKKSHHKPQPRGKVKKNAHKDKKNTAKDKKNAHRDKKITFGRKKH